MSDKQIRNGFHGPLQTILQDCMADWVFSVEKSPQEIADEYLTADYVASIDGHELDKATFVSRLERIREEVVPEIQEFLEMMEEGNKVFSMHTIRGVSRTSGEPFDSRVIALFIFENQKIKRVYLNSVTLGDPRDADLASRS